MRKLCILLLFSCSVAQAGVVVGGTRFVISEKKKSVSVSVYNRSVIAYLVNSKVTRGDIWSGNENAQTSDVAFTITPPLFSLAAGRENTLRIVQTDDNLPSDRESLYTVSIAAIPSGAAEPDKVQLAVRSNLKLFYRPSGLKGSPEEAYRQLVWRHTASGLIVENKTPYYVTLFNLKVNGKAIDDAGVVAPFSQRQSNWCTDKVTCQLVWQSINDYGRVMPVATKNINIK